MWFWQYNKSRKHGDARLCWKVTWLRTGVREEVSYRHAAEYNFTYDYLQDDSFYYKTYYFCPFIDFRAFLLELLWIYCRDGLLQQDIMVVHPKTVVVFTAARPEIIDDAIKNSNNCRRKLWPADDIRQEFRFFFFRRKEGNQEVSEIIGCFTILTRSTT